MKDFNNAIANMTAEEIQMAINEHDNITLQTLTQAILSQQKVSESQGDLYIALQESVMSLTQLMRQHITQTSAKMEVMSQQIKAFEDIKAMVEEGDLLKGFMKLIK